MPTAPTKADQPSTARPPVSRKTPSQSRAGWNFHVGGAIVHTITKEQADYLDTLPVGEAARERRRLAAAKPEAPPKRKWKRLL